MVKWHFHTAYCRGENGDDCAGEHMRGEGIFAKSVGHLEVFGKKGKTAGDVHTSQVPY